MTASYLDEALRACRLPIDVWTEEEFTGDPTLCCVEVKRGLHSPFVLTYGFYELDPAVFKERYVALRSRLLQAEKETDNAE